MLDHNIVTVPISKSPMPQVFPVERWFDEAKQRWRKKPKVLDPLHYEFEAGSKGISGCANIGIFPPRGLVFLDLDLYKGVTRERVEKALGAKLDWDNAKVQDTISGGEHFAFKVPVNAVLPNRDSLLGVLGFDLRVAGKGWICTGRGYKDCTLVGLPQAITVTDWPALPDGAVKRLSNDGSGALAKPSSVKSESEVVKLPTSLETLERLVDRIKNVEANYDKFFSIGAALHYETLGTEAGYQLWLRWSRKLPSVHDETLMPAKWRSFHPRENPITIGTLRALAKTDYGEAADEYDNATAATFLAERIHKRLFAILGDKDLVPWISEEAIAQVLGSCFWSGAKGKLFLLGPGDILIQCGKDDFAMFFRDRFRPVADYKLLSELARQYTKTPKDAKTLLKELRGAIFNPLFDWLKVHNQRDRVEYVTDLWTENSWINILPEKAVIVLNYKPIVVKGEEDEQCVRDFKLHFSRFDKLLEFLAYSKVSPDRKKSYLWILADSDWGKGFTMGVMRDLGIVVEISTKSVEAIFEDKPVALDPIDFLNNYILLIDEFKAVKSELKQLQSKINIAPKFQLRSQVEIFAKIFTSAESVDSLIGDSGLEDQFANRFSIFEEHGDITKRPLYIAKGGAYFEAIKYYTACKLNELMASLLLGDKNEVQKRALNWLTQFNTDYTLTALAPRLSESLADVADTFYEWLNPRLLEYSSHMVRGRGDETPGPILMRCQRVVTDFLASQYSRSEFAMLNRKKRELYKFISPRGHGYTKHRTFEDKSVRGIRLDKDRLKGL